MEHKNIIIILLVIIIILAAAIGVMLLNPTNAKEPTKIKIISSNEQYENGEISATLTDLNETPIPKEALNITITTSKGEIVKNNVVKTNSKGEAILNLDLNKGNYNINITYKGNENYTGNNTTQKLTIKEEEVVQAELTSSSSTYDPGAFYSQQSLRTYYTGDIVQEPGGGYMRHLGNNQWEPV